MTAKSDLMTLSEASEWATELLGKNVTASNISYLVQYGRIQKHTLNGSTKVSRIELKKYYDAFLTSRKSSWMDSLGDDINWDLSFENLKESETTKHVHRLHPYKGKFIPQLVQYFIDSHTDEFKDIVYFEERDIILDPFCGSGTTLVQANETGLHAIGIDVSRFNSLISNIKVQNHDMKRIELLLKEITHQLENFSKQSNIHEFEDELSVELSQFNNSFFPSPEYKYNVRHGLIDEDEYGSQKEEEFLPIYENLLSRYNIQLQQTSDVNFLDKWYLHPIRQEIDFIKDIIDTLGVEESDKRVIQVILSRTIRSCRATTHADLATLKDPVFITYYCAKHGKICKPLFSMLRWWKRYSKDTIKRLKQFNTIRTNTFQYCLTGNSATMDIIEKLNQHHKPLRDMVQKQKIRGIFSSPPYLGLIDYHEQHAYAYELFGFERQDNLEIGSMSKGKSKSAAEDYVSGISSVLVNSKRYMVDNYDVFLVANDKSNLYPRIAEMAGMKIVKQFHRPVLNRTERDKLAYSETIFHLKAKGK